MSNNRIRPKIKNTNAPFSAVFHRQQEKRSYLHALCMCNSYAFGLLQILQKQHIKLVVSLPAFLRQAPDFLFKTRSFFFNKIIYLVHSRNQFQLRHLHLDAQKLLYGFIKICRQITCNQFCRWILRTNTPPPMRFAELMASDLPAYLNESVQELLRIKMEVPELQFIPKADVINTFIEEEIPRLKEKIRSLPEERRQGYDELNTLFLKYLR